MGVAPRRASGVRLRRKSHETKIARGGYVISEATDASPRAVIIATGSEVQLALGAQKMLATQNLPVRVVSMPSTSVFDRQEAAYRQAVLPRNVPRVAVEETRALLTGGWGE